MHSGPSSDPQATQLQPAGRRWGFGAHSVMPYLVHTLPAPGQDARDNAAIRNPVFPHMDPALRALRRQH